MTVVIALGGNALLRVGDPEGADAQRARVADAASAIADIARGQDVVLTHGNGPQVGLLALQAGNDAGASALPLDVLGAESEGMIGYWLERELSSIFPSSEIATLLTQVEVSPDDPAFNTPSKPIGPRVHATEADLLAKKFGWTMQACSEPGAQTFRRVVPSPEPLRIRELRTIQRLVDAGVIVICGGGGGIPVVETREGGLRGVDAVIDKDRTTALLAENLAADHLLLLTNVPAVFEDWPAPRRRAIRGAHPDAIAKLSLEAGTMGPKVEAAARFARNTGMPASIGSLDDARRVLEGRAGTLITTGYDGLVYWPGAD
jgi:carbamate kinase